MAHLTARTAFLYDLSEPRYPHLKSGQKPLEIRGAHTISLLGAGMRTWSKIGERNFVMLSNRHAPTFTASRCDEFEQSYPQLKIREYPPSGKTDEEGFRYCFYSCKALNTTRKCE